MTKPALKATVRERIVETALPLFCAQGFRATGIDKIIAASGVAKASFYRHFPSKDDLVLATLAQWHAGQFLALKASTEKADEKTRPLAVFDALAKLMDEPAFRGCLLNTALMELGGEARVRALVGVAKSEMRVWFEEGLAAAGFADMAEALSHEWLMLYDGAMITAVRDGNDMAAKRARATAERSLQQIQLKRLLSKTLPA